MEIQEGGVNNGDLNAGNDGYDSDSNGYLHFLVSFGLILINFVGFSVICDELLDPALEELSDSFKLLSFLFLKTYII